jgi:branched-chain amino acid transport system substrate-binding protein
LASAIVAESIALLVAFASLEHSSWRKAMEAKLKVMALTAAFVRSAAVSAQYLVVKIGHVAPTSGGLTAVGMDNENGVRMAIDELNAKGIVIGGTKVHFELLALDDATNPNRGVAAAKQLVDEKVSGVVGHLTSCSSIAASKTYSDAGIAQISPSSTNPKFTRNGHKTAFRVVADDTKLGSALGRYAVKNLKATRIAVVDDGSAYGQGVAGEFSKAVMAAGGSVVETQSTDDKTTEFTARLGALKSKSPDLVFFGGAASNLKCNTLPQVRRHDANQNFVPTTLGGRTHDDFEHGTAGLERAGHGPHARVAAVHGQS